MKNYKITLFNTQLDKNIDCYTFSSLLNTILFIDNLSDKNKIIDGQQIGIFRETFLDTNIIYRPKILLCIVEYKNKKLEMLYLKGVIFSENTQQIYKYLFNI